MAIPGIPGNFNLQQGNADAFLSWSITAGATSYSVQRSTDGVTYSVLTSPVTNYYLDTSVTVGTLYYYKVAATNSSGTSSYTNAQNCVPTNTADLSLGQLRVMAQQRADLVGSNFVTMPEWNTYINQSYFELYDLLVTLYEDFFLASPYTFTTDGVNNQFSMPSDFYKLMGVDCGQGNTNANAWITLKKFEFIKRNRYVYPQVTSTFMGVFNLGYRLMGNKIMLIPTPSSGQYLRVWYIPKLTQLLQDTDIVSGVSGWTEYVIIDAAIKAMQKEESDTTLLMQQKMMMIKRIEDSAMNRDAGQPDCISNVRGNTGYGGGGMGFDGPSGGY
jgi:fibronectin type 3 domain-containing protein